MLSGAPLGLVYQRELLRLCSMQTKGSLTSVVTWVVLFETIEPKKCFGMLPQICASTQPCLGAIWTIPLTSWLGFCSDMHCQLWDLI